jgi:alkanesulfonate monooxygenase SsuD/methylene tetrahydromethanopterin reductase-like flavin-dependent oxidoreductase (luciferase family)
VARRGGPEFPKAGFPGATAVGALRYIVVADTAEQAENIARPAAEHHLRSLHWLWAKHGHRDLTDRLRDPGNARYEDLVADGVMIAGTPDEVRDRITAQSVDLDFNYMLGYMMFGDMSLPHALRSLDLFSREVMPAIRDL